MKKYRRTIEIDVEVEGALLRCTSRMQDEYHSLELRLAVDLASNTVSACEGTMHKHPYAVCPGAVASLAMAVGLPIAPGAKKTFRRQVPKALGCAHFTEIVDNTLDFLIQKLYWDGVGLAIDDREAHEARLFGFLNQSDTCYAFNRERGYAPKVSEFLPEHPGRDKKA